MNAAAKTAALAERYVALAEARASIDAQLDSIKSELRALGAGTHNAGLFSVSVTPSRRVDENRVAQMYPPDTHPEIYTQKVDAKKLRAELPPKVVDSLMVEVGEPRVIVR